MNRKVLIEVRDLVTHYGEKRILDGVSLDVHEGEILTVIGSSGCGKTTLLKHLVGLLRPTSGSIRLWDRDIVRLDEDGISTIQSRIGIAFQSGGLFNSMNVAENVALPLREMGWKDEKTIRQVVRFKLSLVGLAHAEYLMPSELSGGMKKRAGFARAIALDPEIVFFDEPSAGLDPIISAGLDQLILSLRRVLGKTMVVVTHELASIETISDRILMLDGGKVIFWGTLQEARDNSQKRVRQFFDRKPDEVIGGNGRN